MKRYGLPIDLGEVDVELPEVAYYLYLPIKLKGQPFDRIPRMLLPLSRLLDRVYVDLGPDKWKESYVYLTVKKMFVGGGVTANRPGWHADGFGTEDLNYVWYDCVPTLFNTSEFVITDDHIKSLEEFAQQALPENDVVYPVRHLLRLDSSVVHRVADQDEQIMRTFVKISVSKDIYNLKDNSINHELEYSWPVYDRKLVRNDPTQAQKDSYTPVDDHLV